VVTSHLPLAYDPAKLRPHSVSILDNLLPQLLVME
jgi:hypothetical protein